MKLNFLSPGGFYEKEVKGRMVLPEPPKLIRGPRLSELKDRNKWLHFTKKGTKVDCGRTCSRSYHQFGAEWKLEPGTSLTA